MYNLTICENLGLVIIKNVDLGAEMVHTSSLPSRQCSLWSHTCDSSMHLVPESHSNSQTCTFCVAIASQKSNKNS